VLCDVNYSFTVCGDFNLPNIDWSCDLHPQQLPVHESVFSTFVIDNGLYCCT
jgi:hypothetical protein